MRRSLLVTMLAMLMVIAGGTASALAEGCANTCSVGAVGTGGENSDGNANGGRLKGLSTGFPGATFTNQGNDIAGHISVTGTFDGMGSGAFTPQDVLVGHYEGVTAGFFGVDDPCSGICG
jgi:hypothetical protein